MKTKEYLNTRKKGEKPSLIIKGMAGTAVRQLLVWVRCYVDALIDLLFSLYWEGARRPLPALRSAHAFLACSATELARQIRDKELKSEDLVSACITRIKEVQPIVNAVTDECFAQALQEARAVDARLAAGLSPAELSNKPFLGVPFTAKESHAVRGMRHTLGLVSRREVRAHADAECVRLLRDSGAICLAVTNVPEINKWQESRNMVFGQTNNPYHSGRSPGGSSGGEAALAASYASPISLCSDIGGSTRMPAFYCGLFGHNPTAGITSLKGSGLRSGEHRSMACVSVVARRAEDLAPLTAAVAGERAPLLRLQRHVLFSQIKFFYTEASKDIRVSSINKELKAAMKSVIGKISAAVTSSEHAPRPYYHEGLDHMFSLWRHAMTQEADSFPHLLTNQQGEASGLLELAKKMCGLSAHTLAAVMKLLDEQVLPPVPAQWAEPLAGRLRDHLLATLGEDGVLLFPSAPQPAPYHYSCFLRPYNFAYWAIINVLGFPATQVPLGLDARGLPLGVQVVAAPHCDALALHVAGFLERELGGFVPPCAAPA